MGYLTDGIAGGDDTGMWSKNIRLSNSKHLLIMYLKNLELGPGAKGGSIDIKIFNQILSTFKFL